MKTPAAFFLFAVAFAYAQDPACPPGQSPQTPEPASAAKGKESIEIHLAPASATNRMAVILTPSGDNIIEVTKWLNSQGFSVFVLPSGLPDATDSQWSVRMIRLHANEWGIDSDRIGVMGFAEGATSVTRTALHFEKGERNALCGIDQQDDKPNFVVLVNPVLRQLDLSQIPHDAPPAFLVVAGTTYSPAPPAFLTRTHINDPKDTVDFFNALINAKIPVELHVYTHGGQGSGIIPGGRIPFNSWQDRFLGACPRKPQGRRHEWNGTGT